MFKCYSLIERKKISDLIVCHKMYQLGLDLSKIKRKVWMINRYFKDKGYQGKENMCIHVDSMCMVLVALAINQNK
jgi:hypothetical protein